MGDCVTLCEECGQPIAGLEAAHLVHEDCDRFLGLECRCDKWVCLRCCPECELSPLQETCQVAREQVRTCAEEWEQAQSGPASVEPGRVLPHPMAGLYGGAVG